MLAGALRLIVLAVVFIPVMTWVLLSQVWDWMQAHPVGAVLMVLFLSWRMRVWYRKDLADRETVRATVDARLRDEHVPSMSPHEYELFVCRQFERAGWSVRHVGQTGDQGCDAVAELGGFRAVVQCKLYRTNRCGNAAVQEVVAARHHYGAQVMVVVCPSGFTPAAQQLAASNHVWLMHHNDLAGLARLAKLA